ncbi:MAG: (p)ppGpp synthetase [Candidatus Wallbacteria bacterium HGW-Wallbacteria-1]|jgi:GTP pyrophosphokinase|uniref:(P)ppGpp synthetase n=1 Tax=Candidatus Wallbacteria bacterium HGW-Wallbacteria-1 TaxID=2013854 RepID=A0A2N1PTQ6_9BACT|nr:MAG: (p)ppGpp synthetase [Candidatus Wallbacteria bacterium HGW-Wallbacteria-1]
MFENVDHFDFSLLESKIREYAPDADIALVRKAYDLASEAHKDQRRKSGEPYFLHPFAVAIFLADLNLDTTAISAALLHDVIEDTDFTFQDLEKRFGKRVALLVEGVTKLSKISFKSKMDRQAENLRKMLLAMIKDVRVILIKLADRLHNMMTLQHMSPRKQLEIAAETVEIYAPIAHRLGINVIKSNLEDLALKVLHPDVYREIKAKVDSKRFEREDFVNDVTSVVERNLEEVGVRAKVYGRPKHFYSIFMKMKMDDKDFSEIFDLMGFRIITETVKDCYAALGIIHKLWKPLHGRFKDYIAVPKPNMYQSLHTTIIHPRGEPLEFQIRTHRMHQIAEEGIAAHWHYKQGAGPQGAVAAHVQPQPQPQPGRGEDDDEYKLKLSWLKQLIEWHREVKDSQEFIEGIKVDLFQEEVFVFTPQGDIKVLPTGANPIDFAFAIHTEVGHQCVGAKVNGKIVPLSYALGNGDVVDILTSKKSTPSRDWLKIVKSQSASNKIKAWFKKHERDEIIVKGREQLQETLILCYKEVHNEEIISREESSLTRLLRSGTLETLVKAHSLNNVEELFYFIGLGRLSPKNIISELFPKIGEFKLALQRKHSQELAEKRAKKRKLVEGVKVSGMDNMLVKFAHCCNPLPGDDIVGFITVGRGISIHRSDCYNTKALKARADGRMVEVSWDGDEEGRSSFFVKIKIKSLDRRNLLQNVTNLLANERINIHSAKAMTQNNDLAQLSFVLEIRSKAQLETLLSHIRKIPGILDVTRVAATMK